MGSAETLQQVAAQYASRSSRRGFLRFAGSAALALGLGLHGVSLVEASAPCYGCVGCEPDGKCNAGAGEGPCSNCNPTGCPNGCSTTGYWTCCNSGCYWQCSECCCNNSGCYCFSPTCRSCGSPNCPCLPGMLGWEDASAAIKMSGAGAGL
jgi:hypothetical protein